MGLKKQLAEKKQIYPNPECPYCNEYERLLDKVRILWVIGVLIIGGYLIYTVRDQVRSDCCQALKKYNERFGGTQVIPGGLDVSILENGSIYVESHRINVTGTN